MVTKNSAKDTYIFTMNALTSEVITRVGSQVHPDKTLHPTSIAYIQTLLRPYADALEPAASLQGIVGWVPLALPGQLAERAILEIIRAIIKVTPAVNWQGIIKWIPSVLPDGLAEHAISEITKTTANLTPNGEIDENDPEILRAARDTIIEYLTAEIVELSGNHAYDVNDMIILPWDIQGATGCDEELARMFGTKCEPKTILTLPVDVVVGPQHYSHKLTEELTCGILLFGAAVGDRRNFNISMFGTPFSPDYMLQQNRFSTGSETYTVDVGGRNYTFNSVAFMQGISTGAQWMGIDHHTIWSNLLDHSQSEDGVPISF
ncbi:Hypothetical protein HVR_LOCUS1076 [uncultured virus]|nr:Hypothetical protein HVR_LOCUS1076 [uncultured virus]